MALVQCMDAKKHITFGDLATDYCRQLTSCFAKAHTVADVFDRYDVKKTSIKSAERERRTKVIAHTKVFQVIEGRNIPDWKKFLSVKENKQALINVFGNFIVKFNQSNPLVPPGNMYYIAGSFGNPEIVKVVSDQEVFDCPDLYSTQEEADTRMILQALHADKRLKNWESKTGSLSKPLIQMWVFSVFILISRWHTPVNCGSKWKTLVVLRTIRSLLHPPIITLTNCDKNLLQVGMQVSIFFVPHARPKFGILPVWQNPLCLHQWNTDGELSRILCIQSTLKETCQQNFPVI